MASSTQRRTSRFVVVSATLLGEKNTLLFSVEIKASVPVCLKYSFIECFIWQLQEVIDLNLGPDMPPLSSLQPASVRRGILVPLQ